ncbi:hypothetical protein PG984_011817 [Apiospora sp. TS-2023a]
MTSSSGTRRVTFVTDVNTVYTGCWHLDTRATPKQRRVTRTLHPDEPEPEETHTLVNEAKTQGTCPRCTDALLESRKELKVARNDVWAPRLGADSEVGKAFRLFFTMEQQFLMQFMQAAKAAVDDDGDLYHREPLAVHARQIRQLVLFGNELQREVVAHERPNPQIVECAIFVLGKSYLAGDVWQTMSDSDLRDGFEVAVPAIMDTVLAMRPNPNLDADVLGVMGNEFRKAGLIHSSS